MRHMYSMCERGKSSASNHTCRDESHDLRSDHKSRLCSLETLIYEENHGRVDLTSDPVISNCDRLTRPNAYFIFPLQPYKLDIDNLSCTHIEGTGAN